MLFVVKERLEDLQYNIDFRGRAGGTQGMVIVMFTMQKRGHFIVEVSPHFCPSLQPFRGSGPGGHFVLMDFIHKNMICI